jgi:hypothetical protein
MSPRSRSPLRAPCDTVPSALERQSDAARAAPVLGMKKHEGGPVKPLATLFGLIIAISATSVASAEPQSTDFGVRSAPSTAPAAAVAVSARRLPQIAPAGTNMQLSAAVAVVSRFGRVTSTTRTAAHNKAVGGVRNSYHLRGRAIDVVPGAGVRHAQIDAALRAAGFQLIESLNEGDHSHFAFGVAPARAHSIQSAAVEQASRTQWRMVVAPQLAAR